MNTRGKFILNMTGRGNVLGMNAKMSRGNCGGKLTNCAGKRAACCVGVGGPKCCEFPHGGKPAPQMGYGVYLNRKSKGAYHPSGGKQCKTLSGCKRAKTVWKQHSNLDASVVITNKKDNVLACNSDVYTAKRDTCTGCSISDSAPNANNNFTVGNAGTFWGFDGAGGTGNLVPNTIDGSGVEWIGWNTTIGSFQNQFYINLQNADPTMPQDHFDSISFINCNNPSIRTYYTTDAAYNPTYVPSGGRPTWRWDAAASGYSIASESAYWQAAVGQTLKMYIDTVPDPTNICPQCCCPVKKNICGCRATDLVRYTRINKTFGCQTTKAVRMGRSASEQIARNRAKVDCIKPIHRTIFINIDIDGIISFVGCCGDQCLIPGQQYTFNVTNVNDAGPLTITWCIGLSEMFLVPQPVDSAPTIVTFNVPKFNTSSNCIAPTHAVISNATPNSSLRLDYCKQAFKKPQMLGSCSGR